MTNRYETLFTVVLHGHEYELAGSYDTDMPEGTYEFYDIFEDTGNCVNDGSPFYTRPTYDEVVAYIVEHNRTHPE